MKRFFALTFLSIFVLTSHGFAAKEEKQPELMYPLTLRRPVFETLLDLTVNHDRLRSGRETELAAELEVRALPWWRISAELPFVIMHEAHGPTLGGIGDVGIENSFRLFRSTANPTQVIAGFEVRVPSGSKSRGLGGETTIEPFLAGGLLARKYHFIAEAGYEWTLNSPAAGERKQELGAGLAIGYELTERFLPLLELRTARMIRGENEEDAPKLKHKGQVYLNPGLNVKLFEETTLRFGVELPATNAR